MRTCCVISDDTCTLLHMLLFKDRVSSAACLESKRFIRICLCGVLQREIIVVDSGGRRLRAHVIKRTNIEVL